MTPRRRSASFSARGVADADEEEVRDGRAGRLEARARGARRWSSAIASRFATRRRAISSVSAQARERGLLAGRRDVERAAHLPDRRDHVLGPDAVADAQPGEPEDLRERAQDEHAVPALRSTRRSHRGSPGRRRTRSTPGRATVRTCGGTRSKYASSSARLFVVPVGLFGAAMKTSFVRGVIAASIASRSIRSSRKRDAHGDAAELQRVEHVARERRPAGDDLVARVERRQADVTRRRHRHRRRRSPARSATSCRSASALRRRHAPPSG